MAVIKVDAKEAARHIIVRVKTRRMAQWQWRLKIVIWLLWLASKISWIKFEVEQPLKPYLYYCPKCRREVAGYEPGYGDYLTIACRHCHYQFLIRGDSGPKLVTNTREDGFISDTCGCHFTEFYGFVPSTGCPIRDRGGNAG